MNWLIIISIVLLLAVIATPIIWLAIMSAKNNDFQGKPVDKIRFIKEWEMIETMYDKQNKS